MFQKVDEPDFVAGEHAMLRFWEAQDVFRKLQEQNAQGEHWSFLDGPITANNPMGVHHAWGRTYKDAFQRYRAMTGRKLRYQNGFDCQGLWVEVEVEKELNLGTKTGIADYGIDRFVRECKKRVLKFAARQTEQSIRLGYWMEWDDPAELRKLSDAIGGEDQGLRAEGQGESSSESLPLALSPRPSAHNYRTARGQTVTEPPEQIAAKLGNPEWGGSYFTFSTENNETIWSFLKKCYERKKIYQGHDVMPWSGRAGSAYSQMEVADGRKLTTHRSCFVRFRIVERLGLSVEGGNLNPKPSTLNDPEYLLVWTTTPWTLTSNVACAVNPELEYVQLRAKKDGALYYFAKENLEFKRLEKEFKEGFGRPEWSWPDGVGKLKSIAQLFKEQGGYEIEGTIKGAEMVGWRYEGPFDELDAANVMGGSPPRIDDPDSFDEPSLDEVGKFFAAEVGGWLSQPGQPHFGYLYSTANYKGSRIADRLKWVVERGAEDEQDETSEFGFLKKRERDQDFQRDLAADLKGLISEYCKLITEHVIQRFMNAADMTLDLPVARDTKTVDDILRRLGLRSREQPTWQRISQLYRSCELIEVGDANTELLLGSVGDELYDKGLRFIDELILDLHRILQRSAAQAHRIIDGGRDSKGSAIVVAGEGTGIVHIAPGCGDVDHQIGKALGLPIIAPLQEDGTFGPGFNNVDPAKGPKFTGRRATDPDTAQMVFDSLKEKGLLVAVETYPHIYPFCWRTGDELVFRLVDEWFINMDWREEIKEVVDTIEWLPPSIEGRDREREWLTNMRDWMISKKRFWGLALPIWVNPDDPSDFEVMGSLAELKERAEELDRSEGVDGLSLMVDRQEERVDKPSTINHKPRPSGWDQFEGHTPHRPWIDAVKIRSRKTGAVLSRIVDVGNPWLDAGIVPFSTLNYNEWKKSRESRDERREYGSQTEPLNSQLSTLNWPEWYPPEFVVECFPGQFRNWFYSLLALSTMMRYDETKDPAEKRPFKTLLGHRLVMNEEGKPMHKSDGTAIWFEEAAEQLGVDTLRWLYLAQDPATDLRFGTRHKDEPVTLPTVDGPLSHTREGLACCKVTSKPADEVRRQVLIPLWNSYAFFVNYARLDGFDPARGPKVTDPAVFAKLGELDRWILSNLQQLIGQCRTGFEEYDTASVCKAIAAFIDDLSNWYIRRSRRRFWRSAKESSVQSPESSVGSADMESHTGHSSLDTRLRDPDKWEAYATLYEVLLTLSKLTGPVVPFLAERMYQNLVFGDRSSVVGQGERGEGQGEEANALPLPLSPQPSALPHRQPTTDNRQPESVHLCPYPEPITALIDSALSARMATAERIVGLGLRLRELENLRVRQPLSKLQFVASDEAAAHIAALTAVIAEELNVREIVRADNLDGLVSYKYKPNKKTLGPKYGKQLGAIDKYLATAESDAAVGRSLAPLRRGESVTIAGLDVTLAPEDVLIATERAGDWATADEAGLQIALSTALTLELVHEGMARDFVRHVQQARKDADLEITDRIRVYYSGPAEVVAAVDAWKEYIARETLADVVEQVAAPGGGAKSVAIGEVEGTVWIERV